MGLTVLSTEVDGQLGVDKEDRIPPKTRVQTVPADEYNTLKKRVAEIIQSLGLGDGSTLDSLEAVALAVNAPRGRPGELVLIDDFTELLTTGQRWSIVAGSSSPEILAASDAVAKSAGAGILKLAPVSEGSQAAILDNALWFNGWHWPRFRARIRTPTDLGEIMVVGLADQSDGTPTMQATMQPKSTGWDCVTQGGAGTTTNSNQGTAPTAGTWYDIRIELDGPQNNGGSGACRFYVDDALISTISVGANMPSGDDAIGRFMSVFYGSSASIGYVDWCELRLTRR